MIVRAACRVPQAAIGCVVVAVLLALRPPPPAPPRSSTVGSPLSVPATLNTAENLSYAGTNTNVLPTPEVPTGVVHTYHYGADTALWNTVAGATARRRCPPPARRSR